MTDLGATEGVDAATLASIAQRWLEHHTPFGVLTTDANGVIRGFNLWLEASTGRRAEDIVGRRVTDAFPEIAERGLADEYDAALRGEPRVLSQRFHGFLLRATTSVPGWAEMQQAVQIAPLRREGRCVGTITLIHDVTERVAREAELRAEIVARSTSLVEEQAARRDRDDLLVRERDAKERAERAASIAELFVAVLSHDLRNPLAAIAAAPPLLEPHARTDLERMVIGRVRSSTERMARMIDQVLDVSRIRSGGALALSPRPLDARVIVSRCCHEIVAARHAPIEIRTDGKTDGQWDGDRLEQAFSNLIGNAVEHSPSGARVVVEIDGRDEGAIAVAITNPGVIAEDELPTIFEPFREGRSKRRSRGLGLGLYITREIVRAHGGRIEVASSSATGTRFVVVLPRSGASSAEPR